MTDPEVIRAWFTAHLDKDEELARYLTDQFADPDEFDGGWSLWGNAGRAIDEAVRVDFRCGRALRAIVARRAILALHIEPHECPIWDEAIEGGPVTGYFGGDDPCPTVRLLAQRWADDPTMPEELKLA